MFDITRAGQGFLIWLHYRGVDLGLLPGFIRENDPRDAVTQLHEAYAHAGGWRDFSGFTLSRDKTWDKFDLLYPGDPPMRARAATVHGSELVILFQHDWVAVIQRNGTYRVSRMD